METTRKAFSFRLWVSLVTMITVVPVRAATVHVWQNSPNPSPPYTNWLMAAHSIQEAINTAVAGDTVLVTNGVFASGGRAVSGVLTNRVAIDKAVMVQSVNGPAVTVILGAAAPGGGNGDGAIRCAYVGSSAILSGFTLTNGHTRTVYGENFGGGVWCEDSGLVTNCVLARNSAAAYGGGANGGTLRNCTLSSNSATGGGGTCSNTLHQCILMGNAGGSGNGGGALYSALYHCVLNGNTCDENGGGADGSTLYHCTVSSNSAWAGGGGASRSSLYNCLVLSNAVGTSGGGTSGGWLYNCTVIGNSCGRIGGGAWGGILSNCIVYFNIFAFTGTEDNYAGGQLNYSCTRPRPSQGTGNITNEAAFVDAPTGDYRLRYGSPCIDAGTNLSPIVTNDLAGNPRPLDGNADGVAAFDMGAYEYDPATADSNGDGIPDGWCLRYGLSPTANNVATNNPDSDAFTSFEEWVADTDPTNALSCFRIDNVVSGPPVTVHFWGSSNRNYSLLSCSSLTGVVWTNVAGQANLPGTGGPMALNDTNVAPARFYRLKVSVP